MFRRTRSDRHAEELAQFRSQATELMSEGEGFATPLPGTQAPTASSAPGASAEEDVALPADLRVPPADELAGSMMRYWAPLSVDGTVVTCSECGVYRDWLVLNREDHVWVHCRSGHETYVPGLDGAWFAENSGPITGLFGNRDEGLKSYGYDGFLKGTIL